VRTRVSKTGTGRTKGSSDGERFLEDQSKAEMRFWIQSRVREESAGHERGI
jgi:hypothetical protein